MALIAASDLNDVLDAAVLYAQRTVGTEATDLGIGVVDGSWGAAGAAGEIRDVLLAMTDLEPVEALSAAALALGRSTSGIAIAAERLSALLAAVQSHGTRFGLPNVSNLDGLLSWFNVVDATNWQTLQAPFWRDLFAAWQGGTTGPSVWNVYFEVLQGATYANGLRKLVVGTGETAGFSVDGTKYCGGFPKVKVSGLSGSGTVTVTGDAYDPASRARQVGKTWTAAISGDGTVALTVGTAPANSLIAACSAIEAGVGISAGTFVVEAHRPSGRPLL